MVSLENHWIFSVFLQQTGFEQKDVIIRFFLPIKIYTYIYIWILLEEYSIVSVVKFSLSVLLTFRVSLFAWPSFPFLLSLSTTRLNFFHIQTLFSLPQASVPWPLSPCPPHTRLRRKVIYGQKCASAGWREEGGGDGQSVDRQMQKRMTYLWSGWKWRSEDW